MKKLILCLLLTCSTAAVFAQQKTYCNPVNIDYGYTPYESFTAWGRHRATADPVIVNYKGDFFLFSTNQGGYWHSPDLLNWTFHVRPFLRPWNNETKDDLCAPGVGIIGDTMVVFGSTYTSDFSLWGSTNPKGNEWFVLVDSFEIGGWDPAFFTDDDGRFYMYNGSSNRYPMYGVELDRRTFKPKGTRTPMYLLEDWRYGWQRFGEHNDNTFLDPFAEGAWMTKHNGKYYFQYGAPGTEFSGYSDGVVVGDGGDRALCLFYRRQVAAQEPLVPVDRLARVDRERLLALGPHQVDAGEVGVHRVLIGHERRADRRGDSHARSLRRASGGVRPILRAESWRGAMHVLAPPAGFEPAARRLEGACSIP